MSDELIHAKGDTLDEIAAEIHAKELRRRLKPSAGCLSVDSDKNYALLEKSVPTPEKGIKILPAPAVKPNKSTRICDGKLKVAGVGVIAVTAFRLG